MAQFVTRCIVSPISDRGACIENGPPHMAQFVNAHVTSNTIALGRATCRMHQMTYVVGGIYADSVEGVGV